MSEVSKHTPGPWNLAKGSFATVIFQKTETGRRIIADINYRMNDDDCPVGYDEDQANASLIAAAPELLAACKAIMNAETQKQHQSAVRVVEAAIAKAEGGAS